MTHSAQCPTLAEISRLQKLVESAYREGFADGFDQSDPIESAKTWSESRARTALVDASALAHDEAMGDAALRPARPVLVRVCAQDAQGNSRVLECTVGSLAAAPRAEREMASKLESDGFDRRVRFDRISPA
jgi:hypothetical protein